MSKDWKAFQREQSDDFRRDVREASEQMAKARKDLESQWSDKNQVRFVRLF